MLELNRHQRMSLIKNPKKNDSPSKTDDSSAASSFDEFEDDIPF